MLNDRTTRLMSVFLILAAVESPALAYLDGATGSILLQAAIGLIASWMVYFRLFKARAAAFLARFSGKTQPTGRE